MPISASQVNVIGMDETLRVFGKFDLTRWKSDGIIGGTITKVESRVDGTLQWTANGFTLNAATAFSFQGFNAYASSDWLSRLPIFPLTGDSYSSGLPTPPLIIGSAGDDDFFVTDSFSDFTIKAGDGDDVLIASGKTTVTLDGGNGDDYLEWGPETFIGPGQGQNQWTPGTGMLIGGAGNDTFYHHHGNGSNSYYHEGNATLIGGLGLDVAIYG